MQYLGIDWGYRRAAWCARGEGGAITGEGVVPADEDGLIRLVLAHGVQVRACVEMMSGAVWVRDRLAEAGWQVQVAHAGKVRDVAPLACKTDKVDARVLSELCRRDLVPELWIPSLEDRALRERLRRRMHLVRLRASAMNRIFGLLTQSGLRISLERLRAPDAMELLAARGVEETWRRSIAEAPPGPRRCRGGRHRDARRREGLSERRGVVHAVRELDLSVDRGEVVALLGPNGAGKSTSIDALHRDLLALYYIVGLAGFGTMTAHISRQLRRVRGRRRHPPQEEFAEVRVRRGCAQMRPSARLQRSAVQASTRRPRCTRTLRRRAHAASPTWSATKRRAWVVGGAALLALATTRRRRGA